MRSFSVIALLSLFLVPVARTQNLPVLLPAAVSSGSQLAFRHLLELSVFCPSQDLGSTPTSSRDAACLLTTCLIPNASESNSRAESSPALPKPASPCRSVLDAHRTSLLTEDAGAWPLTLSSLNPLPTAPIPEGKSSSDAADPAPLALGEDQERVQWSSLLRAEFLFLATMHSYRIATEDATREALENHVWGGYLQALGALHGWSDGDGYYETYLGHPIQGAVAGYMWIHNDPKYRVVEFGKSRDYWMSRLRAYAWSYVEIEQFKVGLLSEATLGQVSRYCCAYGFNDHVITSNGGLVWIVGEDAIDRYIVRRIEDHTHNVPLRIIARVALNPPQGMANLMNLQYPWYRENRAAPSHYSGDLYLRPESEHKDDSPLPFIPRFEATATVPSIMYFSNLSCIGGSGVLAYRWSDFWQWTGEVGGCMLLGKSKGWSGDSLTFMMGPQWILHSESRWTPHFHLRAGGQKITEEYCQHYGPPQTGLHPGRLCDVDPNGASSVYAQHFETTGVALSTGGGMDLRLSRALSLRLADVDYVHTWVPNLNGTDFSQGLRFSMGVGLQVGTW